MRIVQEGSGDPRPVLVVYHLASDVDAALRAAVPANVLIANETGPTNTGFYNNVPTLAVTVAALSRQVGAALSPVVLAGHSEGGLVTKRLLDLGSSPDVLVISDGTYGSDYASWKKFADAAKRGEKTMLASYSAGTDKPWLGLKAATGFALPFGVSVLPSPREFSEGKLTVFAYGDGDHTKQGREVLPMMVRRVFASMPPSALAGRSGVWLALGAAAASTAALVYFWPRIHRLPRRT